jgi:transcriptional regulator with XRE-family HTH domain
MHIAGSYFTRLKEERVRLGASQEDFAELVGVSRRTQLAYENGTTSPNVDYLADISTHGADVYYILSGHHDDEVPAGHVSLERLPGFGPADGPARILLPEFLVQKKIGMSHITDVRWAINPTPAMEPKIERHAVILVDVTQCRLNEAVDGETYAYILWGRPDVRRLLHRREHWSLVGFGKGADSTDVYKDDLDSLEIFGTVVGVL